MIFANERIRQVSLSPTVSTSQGTISSHSETKMPIIEETCLFFDAGREDTTDLCTICQERLVEGEPLAKHTACNNKLHAVCLVEWRVEQLLERHTARCPICRRILEGVQTTQPFLATRRIPNPSALATEQQTQPSQSPPHPPDGAAGDSK